MCTHVGQHSPPRTRFGTWEGFCSLSAIPRTQLRGTPPYYIKLYFKKSRYLVAVPQNGPASTTSYSSAPTRLVPGTSTQSTSSGFRILC